MTGGRSVASSMASAYRRLTNTDGSREASLSRRAALLDPDDEEGGPEASDCALAQYADRGTGWYKAERDRLKQPSLVETGRHAGRSRVRIDDARLLRFHIWKRDFFTSVLSLSLTKLFLVICGIETCVWLLWAVVWYVYHHSTGGQCTGGFDSLSYYKTIYSALLFAIETQQTIGYGARYPKDCPLAVLFLAVQCLSQLVLEASCVGLVFARLSHPKSRGRSIFISESAVISRRDGALKFMFRVADIRESQVMNPKITAYLYTLARRTTAEGEPIPFRVEPLKVSYSDGMLLLPVTIEHTIDNASPLYGHSHETLTELNAEIVVAFEGATETGSSFSTRQSYVPNEIHWGHTFRTVITPAVPPDTQHSVSMGRFHEVEPLPGLAMMTRSQLSRRVMVPEKGVVPYPDLAQNTLAISDSLVVCHRGSRKFLMARIGDTCPRSTVTVAVRAYLYRWKQRVTAQGEVLPFQMRELDLRSNAGVEGSKGSHSFEVMLRMPHLVMHEITASSPFATWRDAGEMLAVDADSEIVFQITGVKAMTGLPTMTKNVYRVASDVYWGYHFQVMVAAPSLSEHKPTVNWSSFHNILPHRNPGCLSQTTSSISPKSSIIEASAVTVPPSAASAAAKSAWEAARPAPAASLSKASVSANKPPSSARRKSSLKSTRGVDSPGTVRKAAQGLHRSGYSSDSEDDSDDGSVDLSPPFSAAAAQGDAASKPIRTAAHVRFATVGRTLGRSMSDTLSAAFSFTAPEASEPPAFPPRMASQQMRDHGSEFSCTPAQQSSHAPQATQSRSVGGIHRGASDWVANRSLAALSFNVDDDDASEQGEHH